MTTMTKSSMFHPFRTYAFWCITKPYAMIFRKVSIVKMIRKAYSTVSCGREKREREKPINKMNNCRECSVQSIQRHITAHCQNYAILRQTHTHTNFWGFVWSHNNNHKTAAWLCAANSVRIELSNLGEQVRSDNKMNHLSVKTSYLNVN